MTATIFDLIVLAMTVVLLALLFLPVFNFLWGRSNRRETVLNTFSDESIGLYFKMFAPGDNKAGSTGDETPGRARLEKLYDSRYGLRRYGGPGLTLLFVAGVPIYWSLHTAFAMVFGSDSPSTLLPKLEPVPMLAVAGAYMWVVSDLQQRYRASDLGWQQLSSASLRFIVAVPAAYAFGALAADTAALPVAFLLGAFPTKTIMKFSRRAFRGQLKMEETTAVAQRSLYTLQGVDVPVAERFEDEGITSITQLAYQDVFDLTMRTGYSFSFVVDCASQALAWLYLEEKLQDVRIYGLRGAQEIGNLVDAERDGDTELGEVLKHAAAAAGVDETSFRRTLYEIVNDPYTEFLRDIWYVDVDDADEEDDYISDVRIHAVLPKPEDPEAGHEAVMLVNVSDQDVLLDGWVLYNGDDSGFGLVGTIAAGRKKTVTIRTGRPLLRNTGDVVTLYRRDESFASEFEYTADEVTEGLFVYAKDEEQPG